LWQLLRFAIREFITTPWENDLNAVIFDLDGTVFDPMNEVVAQLAAFTSDADFKAVGAFFLSFGR
jgi:FMN phosphatase YigB (HAD superfamily)